MREKLSLMCEQCGATFVEKRVSSRARFCSMPCAGLSQKGAHLGDPTDRFMQNVEVVGGCWMWTGSTKAGGYGKMHYCGKERGAHRVALALFKGFDIESPLFALHTCDTPGCVNPEHLFPGTQTDNMRDASSKGRTRNVSDWAGAKNPKAKLTTEQTAEIAGRVADGMKYADVGALYGVSSVRVGQIYRAALILRRYATNASPASMSA